MNVDLSMSDGMFGIVTAFAIAILVLGIAFGYYLGVDSEIVADYPTMWCEELKQLIVDSDYRKFTAIEEYMSRCPYIYE